ncbi:MAG: methyltransferase protein [Thelocarpon impressellum]|nr:MAG: methyltransferase protein [Thelocarpon impressellum]
MESAAPGMQDEQGPVFYIGQHETKRSLPVADHVLRQAQDCGYDMLTTPITTPHFHSRVLTLLSTHLSRLRPASYSSDSNAGNPSAGFQPPPPPIIPPLTPADTTLTPNNTISQLLAVASPWTDLCSPDPLIANLSRQVLSQEMAYAAFCGVGNVIVPGPKLHHRDVHGHGLTQYARAIQEALRVGSYLSIQILLPMTDHPDSDLEEGVGSLAPFAREDYVEETEGQEGRTPDVFGTWDAWNVIRTVSLSIPRQLPPMPVQNRWFAEPLRLLSLDGSTFLVNKNNYPVLSKAHQALIARYMRLRTAPWFLLADVGPIPRFENGSATSTPVSDGHLSPSMTADASNGSPHSPTAIEPAQPRRSTSRSPAEGGIKRRGKDPTPHLSYVRHLQRTQPPRSTIERFGAGYQDYLQSPLQPLTDNLESITYEVFEKDPVKYDWYERAIDGALRDWNDRQRPGSAPDGRVVLAVVGAGRGPLVNRALRASVEAGVDVDVWAVEKNPNAYVLLQRHNEILWERRVTVVKSDMRAWKGPWRASKANEGSTEGKSPISMNSHSHMSAGGSYGKVDILVSELLGSFGDNELSPECLDGVQHVLDPTHGISIPASYTAHLTPIAAPRLHSDISARIGSDPAAPETPYVVMLHAIDYLSTSPSATIPSTPQPIIKQAWEFSHPQSPTTLAQARARAAGGVSGGGGATMAGADGANEHNARAVHLRFPCPSRGACNGLAGYFETVLWGDVELSTRPDRMQGKSADMISWFPIYFPLKAPLYFPDSSELHVSIWRQTDDRKVWYEWMVEAFCLVGGGAGEGQPAQRVRAACSELHSSRKHGCLM